MRMADLCRPLLVWASTTALLAYALVICSTFPSGTQAIPPQAKINNFTHRLITSFLDNYQVYNISYLIANGIYMNLGKSGTWDTIYAYMIGSLSGQQLSSGVSIVFCLMMNGLSSQTLILNAATQAINAWGVAIDPVYNQSVTKVTSMKKVGRGKNAIYQQMYRICAQWESQTNICRMMLIAKNHMSLANWNAFHKCIGGIVFYAKCGY